MVTNHKAATDSYFEMNRLKKRTAKLAKELAQNLAEEKTKSEEVEWIVTENSYTFEFRLDR